VFVKFPGPGKSGEISFVLESPGICKAVMQTADTVMRMHTQNNGKKCLNSFLAISLQHMTVMNIYSSMDAAVILYTPLYMASKCCLSLYFNVAGLRHGPGKMLLGSRKVLECFVTKRVGNLHVCLVCTLFVYGKKCLNSLFAISWCVLVERSVQFST